MKTMCNAYVKENINKTLNYAFFVNLNSVHNQAWNYKKNKKTKLRRI